MLADLRHPYILSTTVVSDKDIEYCAVSTSRLVCSRSLIKRVKSGVLVAEMQHVVCMHSKTEIHY